MHWRRFNADLHRDLGYFLSGLLFVYCLSGIALNHVDDWNPSFALDKRVIPIEGACQGELTAERLADWSARVGEPPPLVHDFPTPNHVKLYFKNASLLVDRGAGTGAYEALRRRPLLYQLNVLHKNSLKGWRWVSDALAVLLMALVVSGCVMARGRNGFLGRGKWFIGAGMLPPVIALILFEFFQG